ALPYNVWWQNGVTSSGRIQCLHLHNEGQRVVITRREGLSDIEPLNSECSRRGVGWDVARTACTINLNVGKRARTLHGPWCGKSELLTEARLPFGVYRSDMVEIVRNSWAYGGIKILCVCVCRTV